MKISQILINNFKLLKDFKLELEEELSLVIGKNNTGKTSILQVLDKFLNSSEKNKFTFDDFNVDFKNSLKELIESPTTINQDDYKNCGIKMRLVIDYFATDNLANISKVMMDLDPTHNKIILGFDYVLNYDEYLKLRGDFNLFKESEERKRLANNTYIVKSFNDFLKRKQSDYFKANKYTFGYDYDTNSVIESIRIDLNSEEISIREIINFKFISARRDVTNKEKDNTLSGQTSKIYRSAEASDEQNTAVADFKDQLSTTDSNLTLIYRTMFSEIINKVKTFGGVTIDESEIEVISTLQHRELLDGNTTIVYKHDNENRLPESYNGLGYLNLISMIFEIEILVKEFKKVKDNRPADINLLFIEEPEAHTHPQMQYIFIKNIKKLLGEGIYGENGQHRKLQYIISSHSSCIVADSDFDDIKYLKRVGKNNAISKNLKDLIKEYEVDTTQYQFLKQYLTISRAEIFFADKVICIEGDTERILIPTFMKKLDIEEAFRYSALSERDPCIPLLSQNISIVEVGAYSHIFEKFIDFIGVKSLIITDIDTKDAEGEKCPVNVGVGISNSAIDMFFGNPELPQLLQNTLDNKIFNKVEGNWVNTADGKVCMVYQVEESGYCGRSFEDAFININREFVRSNSASFRALKNRQLFEDANITPYELAKKCINKKTHFALDILYLSDETLSNWTIPLYIKEGLLWLKKD